MVKAVHYVNFRKTNKTDNKIEETRKNTFKTPPIKLLKYNIPNIKGKYNRIVPIVHSNNNSLV
ncbi:hypothetical protein H8356DRAFT_1323532 [Neocallimastix lanati (nom. inval.)]|nr:hypothetical protein H8356DRAFT_1323532 [Neocallimastix sp. JGI-2020a]